MKAPPSGRDNRQYDRVRISSSKKIWNISEGGAYIATENPKRLGSTIHIEFRLADDGPAFRGLAQIVRVLYKPNPKSGEPAGMAVKFVDVSEEQLLMLKSYIGECKQKQN